MGIYSQASSRLILKTHHIDRSISFLCSSADHASQRTNDGLTDAEMVTAAATTRETEAVAAAAAHRRRTAREIRRCWRRQQRWLFSHAREPHHRGPLATNLSTIATN